MGRPEYPAMADAPSPEEIASDALARLAEALRAAGRDRLRAALDAHGMRLTLAARVAPEPKLADPDLPECLARERPATRRVYAIIRDVRAGPGGEHVPLWPADIVRLSAGQSGGMEESTVNHALKKLRDLDLVSVEPKRGYKIGRRQPRLPFSEGQSNGLPGGPDAG